MRLLWLEKHLLLIDYLVNVIKYLHICNKLQKVVVIKPKNVIMKVYKIWRKNYE